MGLCVDPSIQGAMIGAGSGIAGALIGAAAAWWAASSSNRLQEHIAKSNAELQRKLAEDNERAQRWSAIEARILKLSEFAIQYPTLEKDSYCQAYPNCPGNANGKERYENYCVYVFNVLSSVFDYCEGDTEKVESLVVAEELVRRHYRCWRDDVDNLSHDEPFQQYVQSIINDLRKRGKIQ